MHTKNHNFDMTLNVCAQIVSANIFNGIIKMYITLIVLIQFLQRIYGKELCSLNNADKIFDTRTLNQTHIINAQTHVINALDFEFIKMAKNVMIMLCADGNG